MSLLNIVASILAGILLAVGLERTVRQWRRTRGVSLPVLSVLLVGVVAALVAIGLPLLSTNSTSTPQSKSLCAAISDVNTFNQTHHSSLVQVRQSLEESNRIMALVSPVPPTMFQAVATTKAAGQELLALVSRWIQTVKQSAEQRAQTQTVLNQWRPAQQQLQAWYHSHCPANG